MASVTKKTQNSWTQLKSDGKNGRDYFIDSVIYSPDGRFALNIAFYTDSFTFRAIEMATGEFLEYDAEPGYLDEGKEPFTYYFVNERSFVLVTFTQSTGQFEQQLFRIYCEGEINDIDKLGWPVTFDADFSPQHDFNVGDRRGCEPLVINGKRFLALPSVGGFVLTPYHPWESNPVTSREKCIYISLSLNVWKIGEYVFSNNSEQYHCKGSKIYFAANKLVSLEPDFDGEDVFFVRKHFDRLVELDLSELDLEKNVVVINEESALLSIVELKRTVPGSFTGFKDCVWSQDGRNLVVEEMKQIADFDNKRPAVKRRIYVIDLEKMTVSLNRVGIREDCQPSVYNGFLLIWRSRIPIERKLGAKRPKLEDDECENNIYEYKTVRIANNQVQNLQSLTRNYVMLGKNCSTLSKEFIKRFFFV